jgi:hypothetical protein
MQYATVAGYEIAGNYRIAIAISQRDPQDCHIFTPSKAATPIGAFNAAVTWANHTIVYSCWGDEFKTLALLAKDSRCVTTLVTLQRRVLDEGWPVQLAAETVL